MVTSLKTIRSLSRRLEDGSAVLKRYSPKSVQALSVERDELSSENAALIQESRARDELDKLMSLSRLRKDGEPRFADLSLPVPNQVRLFVDRDGIDEASLTPDELTFRQQGCVIKRNFIPRELTDPYLKRRREITDPKFSLWGGSYMHLEEMRAVCTYPPLVELLASLVRQPVALFLTLSGLESTRRTSHQDFYLKPAYQNVEYVAAWIALGEVHPDSGPFEYVSGSHRLPPLRRELVWDYLEPNQRDTPGWPRFAERFVGPLLEEEADKLGRPFEPFIAQRGDVLVWHSQLIHRGAKPKDPHLERPAVVAHYASLRALKRQNKSFAETSSGGKYVVRNDEKAIREKRATEQH